jgi:mono/diheme cytochrome c family protein
MGMSREWFLIAVLLQFLVSLCHAADSKSSSPPKADAELAAPAKADAESAPPAKADAESASPASDGGSLYRQYCQACHMADAKGAAGAGVYPALARNPNLQAASYPIVVVLYGKAGMPWFNGLLTASEIAAIVGYVRTNFGNDYAEPVTAEEVAKMRGPIPKDE